MYSLVVSQKVQFPLGHAAIYRISSYKTLQMRVLLESTTFSLYIKFLELRRLLELRGLFKGGSYMRKYGNLTKVKSFYKFSSAVQ